MTKGLKLTLILWSFVTAVLAFLLLGRDFYVGASVLTHDTFYWVLPSFVHWSRSLWNLEIPFFDFFSNGGVPFTPLIVQLRLLDPIDIVLTVFSVSISDNLIAAFNKKYFLLALINSLMIYPFVALFLKRYESKVLLISILVFSSVFIGTFRQTGLLLVSQWSGLLFFLTYQYFFNEKYRNRTCVFFITALVANSFYGYSYVGYFLAVIFMAAFFIKDFQVRLKREHFLLSIFIVCAIPTLSLYLEKDKFDYPAREPAKVILEDGTHSYVYSQFEPKTTPDANSNLIQDYDILTSIGVFGKIEDFTTLLSPTFNQHVFPGHHLNIDRTNEIYFFLGTAMVPFIFLGFWYFLHHKSRLSQLFILFLLFYLGPKFLFHTILYEFFPPLWPLRHSMLIGPYLQIFLITFAVKGFDLWATQMLFVKSKDRKQKHRFSLAINQWVHTGVIVSLVSFSILVLNFANLPIGKGLFYFVPLILAYLVFTLISHRSPSRIANGLIFGVVIINTMQLVYFYNASSHLPQDITSFYFVPLILAYLIFILISDRSPSRIANGLVFGVVIINTMQLVYFYNASSVRLLERSPYTESVLLKDNQELLSPVIFESAKLHPGCYFMTSSWQAMRYPALLNYERAIYSPPSPEGEDRIRVISEKCSGIKYEFEIEEMKRWSTLRQYKAYTERIVSKNGSLYEDLEFLINDETLKNSATKVTANAMLFQNLPKGTYGVNLFFDRNWTASCDGKALPLSTNKRSNANARLRGGIKFSISKPCAELRLMYFPRLFAFSTFAILTLSGSVLLVAAFTFFKSVRRKLADQNG